MGKSFSEKWIDENTIDRIFNTTEPSDSAWSVFRIGNPLWKFFLGEFSRKYPKLNEYGYVEEILENAFFKICSELFDNSKKSVFLDLCGGKMTSNRFLGLIRLKTNRLFLDFLKKNEKERKRFVLPNGDETDSALDRASFDRFLRDLAEREEEEWMERSRKRKLAIIEKILHNEKVPRRRRELLRLLVEGNTPSEIRERTEFQHLSNNAFNVEMNRMRKTLRAFSA